MLVKGAQECEDKRVVDTSLFHEIKPLVADSIETELTDPDDKIPLNPPGEHTCHTASLQFLIRNMGKYLLWILTFHRVNWLLKKSSGYQPFPWNQTMSCRFKRNWVDWPWWQNPLESPWGTHLSYSFIAIRSTGKYSLWILRLRSLNRLLKWDVLSVLNHCD